MHNLIMYLCEKTDNIIETILISYWFVYSAMLHSYLQ